jgi:signal transduction histidine kinase
LLEAQQEVSPLGILVVSSEGRTLVHNQRFVEMWNFPKRVMDAKNDDILLKEAQKQVVNPVEFLKRIVQSYNTRRKDNTKVYFKDGRVFDRYGSPLTGESGMYYGYVWFFLDITEREKLEKQKDEFISIASHELKTPVTSIKAYEQVLQSLIRKDGNTRAVELLGKMDNQVNRLTMLISDLLDVTKFQSGKLRFKEDYYDFNELVKEVVEEIQPTAFKHKIILELAIGIKAYGDRDRTGQVLTNLLTNAIKYSPQVKQTTKSNRNKVIVTAKADRNIITVSVQDFGLGIPKEKLDKVFERFYRVEGDTPSTYGGLGLGLYISREIIRRQGGYIWAESKVGKGSTFIFTLPIKKPSSK